MTVLTAWLLAVLLTLGLSPAAARGEETRYGFSAEAPLPKPGDLYIAPDGNDQGPGTLEEPLQTLYQALARLKRREDPVPTTVWLRGGEYPLSRTLLLTEKTLSNITFRAYPGEVPVLSGAPRIENFFEVSFLGSPAWAAEIPIEQVRALYGEDGARQVSRWPKQGLLKAQAPFLASDDKFDQQHAFYAYPADLPATLQGATVRLFHWWKDEYSAVYRTDDRTGLIALRKAMSMAVAPGDWYWFENVLSAPLYPGEWVFDAERGFLYYAPRDGETIERTPLYLGLTERLLLVSEVSGITFEGITFTRTGFSIPNNDRTTDFPQAAYDAGAAITVQAANDVHFVHCAFEDLGAGAIRLDRGVTDASVSGCTFEEIGAHAVYVHGLNLMGSIMINERIAIENNSIRGYGRNFYNAAAILLIHARDTDIRGNEISDGTYTAISCGWVWGDGYSVTQSIRILNNRIHSIGQGLLSDMGGIYLLGTQPGTVVAGNVIHDVWARTYGGWGIYLDEGAAQILVEHNLVYRCSAQGFHQHSGGPGNRVINNIFAFSGDGQIGLSGTGSFFLDKNLIVGDAPHLRLPEGGSVRQGNNLLTSDPGVFFDAAADNYNPLENAALEQIGFARWVFRAGVPAQ